MARGGSAIAEIQSDESEEQSLLCRSHTLSLMPFVSELCNSPARLRSWLVTAVDDRLKVCAFDGY